MFCTRCGTEVQENSKFCPSCGLDLVVQTPLGRVSSDPTAEKTEVEVVAASLADEYEILQELGRGGMAIVYRARDKHLEREVALKVLPFSLAFDGEFVERFQREARTAARLEHPNIIPIYRVGKAGRVIYFVMKFLRGKSLSDTIDERGALPPADIRTLLTQAAGALGYAHQHGVVHRDIKPDNIMYDELGHAIVTDFGIAKAASGTRLTGTGMAIGTPHYMSPEQARAQPLDGRSDLYSLGVVAFQCLTGRVPFDGEDAFSIGYKHIMEELVEPALPSAEHRRLFQVVRRMMAKSPEDRHQSTEELVAELEGAGPAPAARVSDVASAPTVALSAADRQRALQASGALSRPSTPTTPMPRPEPAARPRPKKKRRGGLVAASLIVLLGGGGYGGYWYYTNYVQVTPATGPAEDSTASVEPPVDSAALALADSIARADSAAAADSAARAALPDSGWVVVNNLPRGAIVSLDGKPFRGSVFRVAIGTYKLDVTATGYDPYSQSVNVGRGDSLPITVDLQRADAAPSAAVERPATAQCESPSRPNYNLNSACFESRPRLLGSPQVPLDHTVGENPTPVVLWVRVLPDGTGRSPARLRASNDAAFTALAMRYATTVTYAPATKNGRPVEAWFQVVFHPGSRP